MTGAVSFNSFIASEHLSVPLGATHFSLQCAYLNLDFSTGIFEVCYSPSLSFPFDATLITPLLTPVAVPTGTGLKLSFLLVEFYQEINGIPYVLHNGSHNVLTLLKVQ